MTIRNFIVLLLFVTTVALSASAEETYPDTISRNHNLEEVVVTAPTVIRKIDKDVLIPSGNARKLSSNGLQMLQYLNVPALSVDDVMGSVTSLGKTVQIRINGRIASANDVKRIAPDNIKRVEWIANPGLKYDGAAAVINVIVTNPEAGGSFMAQAMPSLTTGWLQGFASLKLNNGKSQWELGVNEVVNNHIKTHREYSETFNFPDGRNLTRTETPISGSLVANTTKPTLSYSYVKPDTTTVYISLSGLKRWGMGGDYTGMMEETGNPTALIVHDRSRSEGFTPSLSAYIEHHLGNRQVVSIDASASHYNGRARHLYTEQPKNSDGTLISDVNTSIHDRNNSFGITANYEKEWVKSKLTAGASYSGNRNRSTYENLDNQVFHNTQDRVRVFGEYRHSLGKVVLTGGMGVQYSSNHFRENNRGEKSWELRPEVSIIYDPCDASRWYLSFNTWQTNPSLAQTNAVAQQIDAIQWEIGNPELKTYTTYTFVAEYQYWKNRFSARAGGNASTSPNAIAPFYRWEDNRLISSYENSSRRQDLQFYFAPEFKLIPGWCNIGGSLRWSLARAKGTGYNLTRRSWDGNIRAQIFHWGLTLQLKYEKLQKSLFGERENWGQEASFAILSYSWQKWQFGAGLFCPFNKYDRGSRVLSHYYSNEKHVRSNTMHAMPFLQLSYNLQWGRQKRGVNKRVKSESSIDESKTSSR